jgi:ABC-2 type transport system permease protein
VSGPAFTMALRLRARSTVSSALALVVVLLVVGALFPAVGDSIGKLHLPKGVADLLGGADYATLTGWYRSEIASFYGPLLISAVAITGAVGATASEEESRILALVLAQPVTRARLLAGKAAAVGACVASVAAAGFVGLVIGVAVAGGGIGTAHLAAFSLHLAFFGLAIGAVALAVAAATGRASLAVEVAAGVGIAGWLVNGFAPLVDALAWLRYLSPYSYYAHGDPLANGVDLGGLAVLAVLTVALTTIAIVLIGRRDLRG